MSSLSLALLSGGIRLREGLEAMLVIAALAAFPRRAGAPAGSIGIDLGAGPGAAHDDQPETVTALLASVLML